MQKTVDEIKKRIEKLKDEEKVFVAYHFYVDGCASASILWRILKKYGVMCEFSPVTRGFEQMTIDRIKKSEPSRVVLVDYVPGDDFIAVLKSYNAEIIDHHTHEKELEQFDYFTSADNKVEASVSYLLSLVAKKIGVKDVTWLGKLGAFWDKCLESTEFFRENIYKDEMEKFLPYNLLICFTQTKGSEKLFQILNESATLEEAEEKIKGSDDYRRAKEAFDNELKDIKFSRKYFSDIKLNIFWIRTKFKHIRIFVDCITYTTPGTHIFVLDEGTRFKLSLRTSLEINLVDLVRELAAENKDFNGGGHPKACGAMLRNDNLEELMDAFIEKYRKMIS